MKKMSKKHAQAIRNQLFRYTANLFDHLDDPDKVHDGRIELIVCIQTLYLMGYIDTDTYFTMERIINQATGNSIDKGLYNDPSYYRFDFSNMISQITEAADE